MIIVITSTTRAKDVLNLLEKAKRNNELIEIQITKTDSLCYQDAEELHIVIKNQHPNAKAILFTPTDLKGLIILSAVNLENRSIDIESYIELDSSLINKSEELDIVIRCVCRSSKLSAEELRNLILTKKSLTADELKGLGLCKKQVGKRVKLKKTTPRKNDKKSKSSNEDPKTEKNTMEIKKDSEIVVDKKDEAKETDSKIKLVVKNDGDSETKQPVETVTNVKEVPASETIDKKDGPTKTDTKTE